MDVELRWLQSFLVVAEEMHFGRAAKRLHLTQPALTTQIRQLEAAMGTTLFERTNRMKGLTQAGRALLPEAMDLVRRTAGLRRLAERVTAGETGVLRLGIIPPGALAEIASATRAFRLARPNVELSVRIGNQSTLVHLLKEGALDLLVCRPRQPNADTNDRAFLIEEQGVILRRDDPLARSDRIRVEDLEGARLLLLRGNPYFGRLLLGHTASRGVTLHPLHEAEDFPSLHWMVTAGLGIAPCSLFLERAIAPALTVRPLDPAPEALELAFCWTGEEPTMAARLWIEQVEMALAPMP